MRGERDGRDERDEVWFVLQVRTNSEEAVLRTLKRKFDGDRFLPFIPKKLRLYLGKGADKMGEKGKAESCFPGYVFFQVRNVDADIAEFHSRVVRETLNIDGAFKFLHYGDDRKDMAVRADEQWLLKRLMNAEFCIDSSSGYKEGDSVKIVSGPLGGVESCIKKVNWHRKTADLSVAIMGDERVVTVGLEYVKKI